MDGTEIGDGLRKQPVIDFDHHADLFLIDRFPNRHVAFGLGIHRCPGSHLARAQFKEIMRQVLERMPDYEVDQRQIVVGEPWCAFV
jgi:cytochrome P450